MIYIILFYTFIIGVFLYLMRAIHVRKIGWIMDVFRDKCTFEIALRAFKEGSTIYRVNGYGRKYTKMETIIRGSSKTQFGTLRDSNFESGCHFNLEDIFASDWIIENDENTAG